MIADCARRHPHRLHAEMLAHRRLHRRPLRAERGKGAGAAAEHRDKEAGRDLLEPLDMADHLVDPHRRLVAESRRQCVLAVRAPGDRHVGAALGEIGHRRERIRDQPQKDPVRMPKHQQVAGLRDVLRRGPPMHPAAIGLAGDAAQFPNQGHDRMAGAGEPLVHPRAVEQFEVRGAPDRRRCARGNDPQLLLRLGERRLDVEPGLPAVLQPIKRADTGIRHAGGGREFVSHEFGSLGCLGRSYPKGTRHAA